MWAALALATDLLFLVATLGFVTAVAVDRSVAAVPPPTPTGYGSLGVLLAVLALHRVTHYRAARPAAGHPTAGGTEADVPEAEDPERESFAWEHGDLKTESRD